MALSMVHTLGEDPKIENIHSCFCEISSPPFSQANTDTWELSEGAVEGYINMFVEVHVFGTFFTFRLKLKLQYFGHLM